MPKEELKEPTHDEIACRAYFRWIGRGASQGEEKLNWFAAETELMEKWMDEKGIFWARETMAPIPVIALETFHN